MTRFGANSTSVSLPNHQGGINTLIVKDSDLQHGFSVCKMTKPYKHSDESFICTVVKETSDSRIGSLTVRSFGCVHQPITLAENDPEEVLFLDDYICPLSYFWMSCFNTADSSFEHFNMNWTSSNRILFHFRNMFAFSNYEGTVTSADIGRKKLKEHPEKVPGDLTPLETEGKYLSPSTGKVVTVHTKRWTVLVQNCLKHCTKAVYGFPQDVQDEIMFHVGSAGSGFIEDDQQLFRRVNFEDEDFDGDLFSVSC